MSTSQPLQSASSNWERALPAIGPRHATACPGFTNWPSDSMGTPCGLITGISFWPSASGRLAFGGHQARLAGAVYVGVDQPGFHARAVQRHGQIGGQGRFAHAALAAADGYDEAAPPAFGGERDADLGHAGDRPTSACLHRRASSASRCSRR
jgi:hypothetical protein